MWFYISCISILIDHHIAGIIGHTYVSLFPINKNYSHWFTGYNALMHYKQWTSANNFIIIILRVMRILQHYRIYSNALPETFPEVNYALFMSVANKAMKPAAMGHTFITLNPRGVIYKKQSDVHLGTHLVMHFCLFFAFVFSKNTIRTSGANRIGAFTDIGLDAGLSFTNKD